MELQNTVEKVFMLMTKDDGRASFGEFRDLALQAAVIADLVDAGLVTLGEGKDPRVFVAPEARTDDPMLAQALSVIAAKPRRASDILMGGKLKPQPEVVARLVGAGVIGAQPKRLAGLVPARYPTLDPGPEERLRAHLGEVLRGRAGASTSDAAALAIIQEVGAGKATWRDIAPEFSAKERKARVENLGVDSVAGAAVQRAIMCIMAGVTAATSAGTAAAT